MNSDEEIIFINKYLVKNENEFWKLLFTIQIRNIHDNYSRKKYDFLLHKYKKFEDKYYNFIFEYYVNDELPQFFEFLFKKIDINKIKCKKCCKICDYPDITNHLEYSGCFETNENSLNTLTFVILQNISKLNLYCTKCWKF